MRHPDYDWFIHHWRDSAHVELIDAYKFIGRVRRRAEAVGRSDVETVIGQALYRALYEPDRFGAMTTILNAIQPTPTIPDVLPTSMTGRPLDGPLTPDGRALRDSGGHFPALGLSAFWMPWSLAHNVDHLDRFAEYALSCGATYVRWFGNHDWAGGTSIRVPNYWDLMRKTIEALAEYNLRSLITLATRSHLIDEPVSYARTWADVVYDDRDRVIACEMVNEADHGDNDWNLDDLHAMTQAFQERAAIRTVVTAPLGGTFEDMIAATDRYYGNVPGAKIDHGLRTFHFARRNNTDEGDWRAIRQPWHSRFMHAFVINNEPQRWDKTITHSVEWAAVAPIVSWIAGCGMHCHHDVVGVFNDRGHYADQDGATQLATVWSRVLPLLPDDLANWVPCRVGEIHEEHPFPDLIHHHWPFANLDHGVSRAFATIRGNRFVMALTGVRDHVPLNDERPQPYRVYSLATGEQVYEGHGPVTLRGAQAYLVLSA